MAKAIYGLRFYLFRKQMLMSLLLMVLFTVSIYRGVVPGSAQTSAPAHDLRFLRSLNFYRGLNLAKETANVFG